MKEDLQERVDKEIARIVSRSGASVGVCAIHVESGDRILINSDRSFPLASSYKIPIAIRLLKRVEQRQFSLDQMIEITTEDLSPGSGPIKELFTVPGVQISLRNLVEMAMRFSDNTASDIVLRIAGGAPEVTSMLRSAGINEIRVDRSTKEILCDYSGMGDFASEQPWSLLRFRARFRKITDVQRKAAIEAFQNDPRDRGTPDALASLLVRLQNGEFLSPEYTGLLLGVMRKCRTGRGRLKGQLPTGTVVAHKTGTLEGFAVNDAGIIDLPDNRGRIAIAVLAESTEKPTAELELTIARIARSIYDAFLFASD
jgi:beta-lactamase class A